MAYTIDRYNNTQLTLVEDGTVDQTTDLKFVGRNYAGYGEIQNENFLFLLENFSGTVPPPRALSGQIWFDSSVKKLKFYDGTKFRTTGGAEVSPTQPTGLTEGDFWWDSANDQLYAFNGTSFILVGPQDAGDALTQWRSQTVRDNTGASRPIIAGVVNDEVSVVLSNLEFTVDNTDVSNAIPGFDRIKKGLTLKDTLNATGGVTSSDYYWWGTASNSLKLGGYDANNYVLKDPAIFTGLVRFPDAGIAVGNSDDFRIKIENDNQAILANEIGQLIQVRVKNSLGTIKNPLRITANAVFPGLADDLVSTETVSLGTTEHKFNNVHATTFTGVATNASALYAGGTSYAAAEAATSTTAAIRTKASEVINGQTIPAGSLKAQYFVGIATQAQFADLAEKYTTDQQYPVGTIMAVCAHADHETEAASDEDMPIGVISAEPAYLMNVACDGQAIGLKGRVPVRIDGPINKGDLVYVWKNGVGSTNKNTGLVGVALETNINEGEKLVECVLKV
jgi:hypothetical protein